MCIDFCINNIIHFVCIYVCIELAEAFRDDDFVHAMVNRDDPIPRISRKSILKFAEKVIDFEDTADRYTLSIVFTDIPMIYMYTYILI